jgi:hypothetical protein
VTSDVEGPTLVRRQLGRRLKTLREASGKTHEDASVVGSRSKLWRLEIGDGPARVSDVKELARLYGASEQVVDALAAMAAGTKTKGWTEDFRDAMPEGFALYLDLEASADHVQAWHPEAVFGLLQTEDYARAVEAGTGGGRDGATIDRTVALRMQRQKRVLRRENPNRVTVVMGAGALARQVGGRRVMEDQVQHLGELNDSRHIEIRILPWEKGAHRAMLGAFTILNFENGVDPSVLHLENYAGSRYLEEEADVAHQRLIFDEIYQAATPIKEYSP